MKGNSDLVSKNLQPKEIISHLNLSDEILDINLSKD